ncbi:hypothetical protein CMK11_02170 [Candidatus Poribacteria bacterium]|jgi:hypothetical protein|nr:hypothetical protein [Candidatus Poribacteria bacterium]
MSEDPNGGDGSTPRGQRELARDPSAGTSGLRFESHAEPSQAALEHGNTHLVERRHLRIGSGPRFNQLIEAENFVALTHLVTDLGSSVDVIYVDPPYNTGMQNLGYGDHALRAGADKHSRWLSFMEHRLVLSRQLLSARGVLYLHVDENEAAASTLLCREIFGENNVDVLIWPKTDPRFDQNRVEKPPRTIKLVHEYVVACFRDRDQVALNQVLRPVSRGSEWVEHPLELDSILSGWGTTSSAKDELADVFGDRYRFQTPKPMRLIKELVRAASGRESVVLDFFAGSGTTGHAVMDLNIEDQGERRFILVNNDEYGICRDITYERLARVMEREGYAESLKFLDVRIERKQPDGGTTGGG